MINTSVSATRPTRRTLVRSAAWTLPVVSIVATAPAFAASPDASCASASTALKWSSPTDDLKHVSWDFAIAIGTRPLSSVSVAFTYTPNGGGGTGTFTTLQTYIFSPTVGSQWGVAGIPATGGTNTATATSPAGTTLAANTTFTVHTDFAGTDNSTGTLTASIAVNYFKGGTTVLPLLTQAWTQASPGKQEPAPHDTH